jgi:hypothetical protein
MDINREHIINALATKLEADDKVHAMWLEGSDGLGRTDEYSDIDFWFDAEDGYENTVLDICTSVLQQLSELDFVEHVKHSHPKIFQRNLHLKGTSEFLLIDICVQSHSRGSEGCTFVRGDIAEYPMIIFDKSDVIKIVDAPPFDKDGALEVVKECSTRYEQRSRLIKYIKRNQYLEACAYYDKYVRQPVVGLYRLLHTPRHCEYGLVHISNHLPEEAVRQIECLYKVQSVKDIENILTFADELYDTAVDKIKLLLEDRN